MIDNQHHNFPSVFVAPVKDNTDFIVNEIGNKIGICAFLDRGTPIQPIELTSATGLKLRSTKPALGGKVTNECIYHIKDFFDYSRSQGKLLVARVVGVTSTVSVVSFDTMALLSAGTFTKTNISINEMDNFHDTVASGVIELLYHGCDVDKISFKFIGNKDEMTIVVQDELGNDIYSVTGSLHADGEDDYGNSNFIGNLVDKKTLSIKINEALLTAIEINKTTAADNFFTDDGEPNYPQALVVLGMVKQYCDYFSNFGLVDSVLISGLKLLAGSNICTLILDIKASTLASAISQKDAFGLSGNYNTMFCWSNIETKYNTGSLNIGYSGFFLGNTVLRNIANMMDYVEDRASGAIAGKNYPLNRKATSSIIAFTNDERELMVKERINPIIEINGNLEISDILSSQAKTTQLRSFPVADKLTYLARRVSMMIDSYLFKNENITKIEVSSWLTSFFETCQKLNFFIIDAVEDNGDPAPPYLYTITFENGGELIVVECSFLLSGIVRQGRVEYVIARKERKVA